MKLALVFNVVVVVVAGCCAVVIEGASFVQTELRKVYASNHIKDLTELFTGPLLKKFDELEKEKMELVRKLETSEGSVAEEIRESIDQCSAEIQKTYQQLLRIVEDIFIDDETDMDSYFKDSLIEKVRHLRAKVSGKTQELANILKDLAADTRHIVKEHIREQSSIITKQLQIIKDQLIADLTELLRREQTTYEESTDLIGEFRGLKATSYLSNTLGLALASTYADKTNSQVIDAVNDVGRKVISEVKKAKDEAISKLKTSQADETNVLKKEIIKNMKQIVQDAISEAKKEFSQTTQVF